MGINLPTSTGEFTGFLNQQPYFTRSAWSLAGLDGPMPGDCFSDARFQWCYRRRCPKNGVMFFFQEISNRTQWMDPYTWVSNSSSNLLRGPLVRSCLFFLFFFGMCSIARWWSFKYRWDFQPWENLRKHDSQTVKLQISLGFSSRRDEEMIQFDIWVETTN